MSESQTKINERVLNEAADAFALVIISYIDERRVLRERSSKIIPNLHITNNETTKKQQK